MRWLSGEYWSSSGNCKTVTALDLLICALAAVGLLIASYFTAVTYRWMGTDPGWIPPVCRIEEQTCALILLTPQARVFGLPNSVLGQIFYLSLILGAWLGLMDGSFQIIYLTCSAVTVVLAVYLSYSLLYVIRVPCVLCFTSHGVNLAIFALLVY